MKKTTIRGDGLLLLTAAIWGLAFVAQRAGMRHIGPFLFNGVRFLLGTLSLLPLLAIRRRRGALRGGRATLPYGLLAGVLLFLASSLQQVGIVTTTAGKAGFITGLYVVFVPLSGLLWGQKAGAGRWIGVLLAACGLYLLSVSGRLSMARGDALVLASAAMWAAQIQFIGWVSPRTDSIALAATQFVTCSALSLFVALFAEPLDVAAVGSAAVPLLYGGVGSVGIAFTLQVVAQREAHPAHAAVIMSLETVFAALGGWLILGETMPPRSLLGCALMLAGMIASQSHLFPRRREAAAGVTGAGTPTPEPQGRDLPRA
jgi:drug/metabolite transporter (DMT)-like permease